MTAAARPAAFRLARPAAIRRARPAVSTVFCWLSVVSAFAFSHLMLEYMGLAYASHGGASWEKLSPATYLAFLAFAALALERGPAELADDIVRRNKGTLVLAATWAVLIWYVLFINPQPVTTTIDTFAFPIALYLVLVRQKEATLKNVALFVHVFMAINALLGLAEFLGSFRLTPIVLMGIPIDEWRSSAFLGHPLMNALAAGSYAVALMIGGGRDLPSWAKAPALALQLLAMPIFGGRAATAAIFLFAAVCLARSLWRILEGRRFSLNAAIAVALLAPVLPVGLAVLYDSGFFDKFIDRFFNDGGSAGSRIVMFEVMGQFSFEELLVGPDSEVVASLQRVYGIAFGIESFWVAFVAYYGLLISLPMFVGLFAFLADMVGKTRPAAWWIVAYFILVCSTSLSLAGKGTMIAVLVALVVATMRPVPGHRRPAASGHRKD